MTTFRARSSAAQRRTLAPAERARSLIAGAVDLRIGVLNMTHEVVRHAVGTDGSVLFLAPSDSPGAVLRVAPRLPPQVLTLTAVDVATVPQCDRVRGAVRLTGPVRPAAEPLPSDVRDHLAGPDPRGSDAAGPVLRLEPRRVALSWGCEAVAGGPEFVDVPLEAYRQALADPLLPYESRWLPHLQLDHAGVLRTLAASVIGGLDEEVDVRPLAMDRFGLVLRLYAEGEHRDVRVGFARPVTCGCELREAFTDLLRTAAPGGPGFTC